MLLLSECSFNSIPSSSFTFPELHSSQFALIFRRIRSRISRRIEEKKKKEKEKKKKIFGIGSLFSPFLRSPETERAKGRDCQHKVSRSACYKELKPKQKPHRIRILRTVKFSSPNFLWKYSWNNVSQKFSSVYRAHGGRFNFRTFFVRDPRKRVT